MPNPTFRRADDKQVGAVIVFSKGVSKQEAESLIHLIGKWDAEAIHEVMTRYAEPMHAHAIESSTVQEFKPSYGGPVWYIP